MLVHRALESHSFSTAHSSTSKGDKKNIWRKLMVNTAIPACLVPFHCLHLRKSNGNLLEGNLLERSSITFAANSRDDTGPIFPPSYTFAVFIAKRLVFTFINYASKIPFLFHFFLFLVVWYIMGGMLQHGYILCRKWKNWWKRVKRKFSLQRAEYEALAQVSMITDDKKQPYNRLPA